MGLEALLAAQGRSGASSSAVLKRMHTARLLGDGRGVMMSGIVTWELSKAEEGGL